MGIAEKLFDFLGGPIVSSCFMSSLFGAFIIAVASGVMFYVDSSSGGMDIIALIVRKYFKINIGKALLITDFLIVIVGGVLSGYVILLSSFAGLMVKTFGIDYVISSINKRIKKAED